MKKIVLLMPVYNDWESLIKLIDEIDIVIKDINSYEFSCVVVAEDKGDREDRMRPTRVLVHQRVRS